MGVWTLLHLATPLATPDVGSTGQVAELSKATSRSLSFSVLDGDTLNFSMANHAEAAAILPRASDVLVFRDATPVQRFRVISRSVTKATGTVNLSFSAVSYKALINAWMFEDSDTRSWATATEQSLIAWTIFNQGQTKTGGKMKCNRGHVPTTVVTRVLQGAVADFQATQYFDAGQSRWDAIESLAALDHGFEWDIVPDPADPYRRLLFHVWATDDGGRYTHPATAPARSDLLLDDGGTLLDWSHDLISDEYANVARFTGSTDTATNFNGTTGNAVWVPATKAPTGTPAEGRWERDINNADWTTDAMVAAGAPVAFTKVHDLVPEFKGSLRRGRWTGPDQLWLGDKARVIVTQLVPGSLDEYLIYIDEDMRVVDLGIEVDDTGAEDVSLTLNRPTYLTRRASQTIEDRLTRLERR